MLALLLAVSLATPPDTACAWNQNVEDGRVVTLTAEVRSRSPQDSVTFAAGGATVKVCYSRPSARGRTMIGGEAVPFGHVWRTGANEPTMIHTTGHLVIAGIHVDAGTYSVYTVPGEREWEIIVNRATHQWGEESNYTDSVRAQEVGRGRVPAQHVDGMIEQFTIRAEPAQGGDATMILEWEHTRVAIPVQRMR
jgi:DUF2911 family protein